MLRPVHTLAILVLLLGAAGAYTVFTTGAPLATLGSDPIRDADFQGHLKAVYPPDKVASIQRSPAERRIAFDEYLNALAITAKARRLGIDQDERFKKAVALMEMKTLAHLVNERSRESILKNSEVKPEEVQAYYEQHKNELLEERRFTAHLLVVYVKGNPAFPDKGLTDAQARAKAKQALAKLKAGSSWDAVVTAFSDEASEVRKDGLIRDGKFGYFAPELEQAIKTQELGKPGELVRTVFGYHVVQVEDRITESRPRPFEAVQGVFTERLTQERSAEARRIFMTPLWAEMGFTLREAGTRNASLMDDRAVAPDEVLAEVAGKSILESDFQWFLKDAFMPTQRVAAFSRPGARQGLLSSFLDMLVLEAKARKDGLDKTSDIVRTRNTERAKLLSEFVQERDKAGVFCRQCGNTDEERKLAERKYFEQLRAEVNLRVLGDAP